VSYVKMLAIIANIISHLFLSSLIFNTNFAIWKRRPPMNEVIAQNHKKKDKNKFPSL